MTMMTRDTDGALEHGANGAAHLRDVSGDASVSGDVVVHGVLEEVSWRTRTAVLYTDDDTAVTVRFTADQDGWLRLVANYPVQVHGFARYDTTGELEEVDLVRLYVTDSDWRPDYGFGYLEVSPRNLQTPANHSGFDWWDHDEFMGRIREMRDQTR